MGQNGLNKYRPRKRTKRSKINQISALERQRKKKEEKQKELAMKREAGLLSDAVQVPSAQEAPSSKLVFVSVPQTSSAQTYNEHSNDLEFRTPQDIDSSQVPLPSAAVESSSAVPQTYELLNDLVCKIPQDINIAEVITSDLQDFSTSQASLSSSTIKDNHTLSFTKCAVESSCTAEQTTSNIQTNSKHTLYPVHITPRDTNISEIVSGIPQNINSSRASVSSAAAVKDNYKSRFFKRFGESSYTVQKTGNFRTYSRHNNNPVHKTSQGTYITKISSGVPQDINSSRVSLSSAAVKGNCTLLLEKSAVESSCVTQTVLNNDPFTLPLVTSTDTYNLPIISNSGPDSLTISSADCSSLPVVSSTAHHSDTNITEIVSDIPQDINSSQASVSSAAAVKNNYKSPFFKRFGESSYTVEKTHNSRTYSRHNNNPVRKTSQGTNITKIISAVPQDVNSSRVSLSSAAVKGNCKLLLEKSAVESSSVTQKVLNNASFTLPLVTSTNTYNVPIISNSAPDSLTISSSDCSSLPVVCSTAHHSHTSGLISKDQPSILPINSTAVKDTNLIRKNLRAHHSVATQVNFDQFKKHKITRLKPLPKEAPVRGRRIIDVQYFFRALKEVNNHSEVGCNLNNMIIKSEKKSGICTSYNLKCVVCNFEKEIWSEKPIKNRNVNTDFVSSILSIKFSFQEANLLLAKMHLPSLGHADFLKEYEKVCYPSSKEDSKKTNQDISGENVQSEPQLTAMQQCSFAEKNVLGDPQLPTMQQCSSASDNSSLLEQVDMGDILVDDQIEIKEENAIENEFETVIPDQRMGTSDVNLIDGQEQVIFTTTIKQEIISDDEDLSSSATSETLNKESFTENYGQSILGTVLPQQNEARASENTMIIDQEQVSLQTDLTVESIQDSNALVKLEHDTIEITGKDNITHFDKEVKAELPLKKARIETYKTLHNIEDAQRIQINALSKEKNIFQKKFESNGLVTATSSTLTDGNVTAISSTISSGNLTVTIASRGNVAAKSPITSGGNTITPSLTNARRTNATSSITNVRNAAVFMSMQHMSKSNGNEALIVSQTPHTISSGTYQGANGAAFIPGTSTMVQQHTGQSSSSVLPSVSRHQSWANNFNTTVNNPLILLPGASGAAYITRVQSPIQQPANAVPNVNTAARLSLASPIFQQPVNSSNNMPGVIPVAVQQPASLSNVVSSASGTTYVSLRPAVVQQPASSLNSPPVNTDGSRWIGRGNMSNNNPFCTLPGGALKDVSDPTTPKSDGDQYNHQSKRPRFCCDDCDISFAKHESWDSHRKIYCIKRLKLPPSSTVTSHTLVNNSFPPNCAAVSIKPHIEELLSAMAIKRSFLESSMKTALDVQYVINLHKSAQDLTRKSFKELDNALNKEKALLPEASLEEQQIVSEARAQALIRAEAAYKQEKHSAAAVEQALYKQKIAIEATLAATGHEQTALVSTLKGLKIQANQNDMSSVYQNPFNEISFNQEILLGTSLTETADHQQVYGISSKSESVHRTSHANVSNLNISGKLSTVNFEENKAVPMDVQSNYSPQYKDINAITSYLSINSPSFQNYRKFPSQKDLDLSVATSAKTTSSPEYEKESKSHDYSHLEEPKDLNARVFSENTYVTVYQADSLLRGSSQMK